MKGRKGGRIWSSPAHFRIHPRRWTAALRATFRPRRPNQFDGTDLLHPWRRAAAQDVHPRPQTKVMPAPSPRGSLGKGARRFPGHPMGIPHFSKTTKIVRIGPSLVS